MGAQFGRWNFDGHPTPPEYLDRVRALLSPYGPDGSGEYSDCGVSLLWFSFETTEANPKKQPCRLDSGEVLVWDGRLDNRPEIARAVGGQLSDGISDVEIAASAWSRWGEGCFARLIGDWSFSLWDPRDRRLILAADVLGSRHLCYAIENDGVRWCSVLDPLVLLSGRSLPLDEEYLAGWLGSFPGAHLTPYQGIHRVPPASLVIVRPGGRIVRQYWDFDGRKRIRYAQDAEYQEHFLDLFRQSVCRRLRSTAPVLAELSGGMDSSSIVCVADQVTSVSDCPQIDTVSYFNDGEPQWNERPWLEKVEAHRGKTGLHIDVSVLAPSNVDDSWFLRRPGAVPAPENPVVAFMIRNGHRVLLSGIGGDEFLGGVPTPMPEIEDLFATGRLITLWRQTLAWALVQRRPWVHLLGDAVRGFLPARFRQHCRSPQPPSWLDCGFVHRQHSALARYPVRWRLLGPLPSFQENIDALNGLRRQVGCSDMAPGYPYERRYPFLDRDLLEFLFAVPREQLVRPGERRSLMRRSLRGLVPNEVLDRRRKAYVTRSPIRVAEAEYRKLIAGGGMIAAEIGILNQDVFLEVLNTARRGGDVPVISILRTLALEQWLVALRRYGMAQGRDAHRLFPAGPVGETVAPGTGCTSFVIR